MPVETGSLSTDTDDVGGSLAQKLQSTKERVQSLQSAMAKLDASDPVRQLFERHGLPASFADTLGAKSLADLKEIKIEDVTDELKLKLTEKAKLKRILEEAARMVASS